MNSPDELPPAYSEDESRSRSRIGLQNMATNSLYTLFIALLVILGIIFFAMLLPDGLISLSCLKSVHGRCYFTGPPSTIRTVVLISMDGLSSQMLQNSSVSNELLNLKQFQQEGVIVERIKTVFPSTTLPTHQTLLTGRYPQDHGIVGDAFWDANHSNISFNSNSQASLNDAPWLDELWPEPIWTTLQKAGRLTGSILWPLTDAPVKGGSPGRRPYQQVAQHQALAEAYPNDRRIDDIVDWLTSPFYNLDLVMTYFAEPGQTARQYGLDSSQLDLTLLDLDRLIGQLMQRLEEAELGDKVDLIITSGSGLTNVDPEAVIDLGQIINSDAYYKLPKQPALKLIYPLKDQGAELYRNLSRHSDVLQTYWLSETPAWLNFNSTSSRMPDILVMPRTTNRYFGPKQSAKFAANGYSPESDEMSPLLMARGPSFKVGKELHNSGIGLVDIYPLLCGLLDIQAKPNNGSLTKGLQLVKPPLADQIASRQFYRPFLRWLVHNLTFFLFLFLVCVFISSILGFGCTLIKRAGSERDEKSRRRQQRRVIDYTIED